MNRRLLWLLVLGLLSATGAVGQDVPAVRVAVYDFDEPGHYRGRLVGRRAAEAVQMVLAASGPWQLVDRAALLRQCAAEKVEPPVGVGYVQMLGRRLDASLAVVGLVESCVVQAERGRAQVTLVAELLEAIGGETLGSFRGVAVASRGAAEVVALEQVVDRALCEAAANLVGGLTAFRAWSTTVGGRLGNGQVLLQPAAEAQIAAGEKAIVCRREPEAWVLIAVVQVRRVDETWAHAQAISELSAPQAGDVAVCVAR